MNTEEKNPQMRMRKWTIYYEIVIFQSKCCSKPHKQSLLFKAATLTLCPFGPFDETALKLAKEHYCEMCLLVMSLVNMCMSSL